ncbi:AAA family ATPase [Eubacterium xylanophilum]|uniref:AAA family ATPase n=1 Tax=Eubacterium xylanophilum TaxID=39497 RepID=UPI0004B36E9E|nr:MoxR family ATPase [Eubacterium xylanophilum]
MEKLLMQINEYFVGQKDIAENVLICLLAGGHVLLEDVPGVGKTTLARIIANSMDCDFGRIQFTPDTLPGDVIGTSVYNAKTGEFSYREGAVMHQILLADEINRTSPKTQASLLETMSEGKVTVDGRTYGLPQPFMVIATQNPVEFLGTYPLPEAQMDRFMMRLSLGYPEASEEWRLAKNFISGKTVDTVKSVCTSEDVIKIKGEVEKVSLSDNMIKYIQDIVRLTREEKRFVLGASPRAMLALIRTSQAKAYLSGRDFVKPDDVKAVAINVLHHRLTLLPEAKIHGDDVDRLLKELMVQATIPFE